FVHWEMALLTVVTICLDFSACASTGTTENLIYVSPKSGQAVSEAAGAPYKDRMLPLPRFMKDDAWEEDIQHQELLEGLNLTGYFLEHHVFALNGKKPPPARTRFIDRLRQSATISSI
ncbi:MAG: DNA repair protein RecO C-terminal domain-containing protein, partial [Proteobacteria bacterium]|nr:DNA repair protein RecO C-terminal domain-containing protein [Pseudomonadota bacterium]